MSTVFRNLLAISIAILPINVIMIWYRLNQTENFSTTDMTIYPLLFGGSAIVLVLLLNKYLVKDTFKDTFNSGHGSVGTDILAGIGLAVAYYVLLFVERATLNQWIPSQGPPNTELMDAMVHLANSPWLMLIWFGPVLWVGIALFEELSRTFLLKCLWNTSENVQWHIVVIFLAAALIGAVHLYQGAAGAIGIGIKGLIAGFYFYKYRRLLPLIIAHGIYDGLQFAFFIIELNNQ